MSEQQLVNTIQKAYIAYYGRAADPEGLAYWMTRLKSSDGDFFQILDDFGNSDEHDERYENYVDWYDDQAASHFINNIYYEAFNRRADEMGLNYYLNLLESGKASLATIAQHIVDGALNNDLLTLNSKVKVSNIFVDAIGAADIIFSGSKAENDASNFIRNVREHSDDWDYYADRAEEIGQRYLSDPKTYQTEGLESGRQVRYEIDSNFDGYLNNIEVITYNDQGLEINKISGPPSYYSYYISEADKFYNEKGLLIRETFDADSDGNAENIIDYEYDLWGHISKKQEVSHNWNSVEIEITEYNSRGQITYSEKDWDGNDIPDLVKVYKYDSAGDLIYEKESNPEYGRENHENRYEYDSSGRLIREERDGGVNGTIEYLALYEYDSQGNITLEFIDHITPSYYSPIEIVPLGDVLSVIESDTLSAQYSSLGWWPSDPVNLSSNTAWDYSYDGNGNITQKVTDLGADGRIDEILSYEYNDEDQITYFAKDSNGDGQNDYIVSHGYDAQGNQIRYEEDLDGDGVVDSIELAYFNSSGDITYQSGDLNADGVEEWAYEWSYEYDQSGSLLEVEFGIVGNNSGGYILRYEFDDQGNKVMEQKENTGVFLDDASAGAYSYYWEYNDNGDLIRQEQDLGSDGELEYALYRTYNSDDELILVSTSGVFEQTTSDYYDVILAGIADSQTYISI